MSEYLGFGVNDFIGTFEDVAYEMSSHYVRVKLEYMDLDICFSEQDCTVDVECYYIGHNAYVRGSGASETWCVTDVIEACDGAILEAISRDEDLDD